MAASTLSRASAIVDSSETSTIKQRKVVQAKSTIHTASSNSDSSSSDESDSDYIQTFTPPTFTVKDLLGAIPKHCFERSALRSFSYLFADFGMVAILTVAATYIDGLFNFKNGSLLDGYAGAVIRVLAWAGYALCTGTIGFGIWVIGHECGHQAFSTSKTLNNTVGLILHSALLTPYHSWRISHARHHAATGSMERDEVFIPFTRSELGLRPAHEQVAATVASSSEEAATTHGDNKSTFEALDDLFEDAPFWCLGWLLVQQLFGWPAYLLKNASGQPYPKWTNHFDPKAVIFNERHYSQIVTSDLGVLSMMGVLGAWIHYRSFTEVLCYYFVPWLVLNHTLVLVTFLQHTDRNLPHYRESEWTFPRGALCTIDRNLGGAIGAFFLHGICETHVAHHICSRIPHYHAWEATEALKSVLGDYYMKSDDNMYYSLVKNYQECRFVEDEGGTVFYKNKQGKAARRVVYEVDSAVALQDEETTSGSELEE